MKLYVALLRGINVGGANTVNMKELKTCFEAQGYGHVETYINTGNIIFSTDVHSLELLTKDIEKALHATFGFPIKTLVKPVEVFEAILRAVPATWTNDTEQKTDVLFLWKDYAEESSLKLLKLKPAVDEVLYIEETLVWHICRKDYAKSGMHSFIGTELYKNMTARNINTVRALAVRIKQCTTQAGSSVLPAD